MKQMLVGAVLMVGSVTGFGYLAIAPTGLPEGDSALTEWVVDVPHAATQEELIMLSDLPPGAPAPAGFTEVRRNRVKASKTGLCDPVTGDVQYLIQIEESIAGVETVEVYVDSALVHSAGRSTGGAIFEDRGALTYVTIALFVSPENCSSTEVLWRDASGTLSGALGLEN